jgi:hypothetical protein
MMTGSTENDTILPYSGDIQAAQAAGDRNAIREIFHHRLRREGAIPVEIRRDLEDPRTAEDENEEDSIDEYNRRVRGRRSLCLMAVVPALLVLLFLASHTSQAAQRAQAHGHSEASSQSPWLADPNKNTWWGNRTDSSAHSRFGQQKKAHQSDVFYLWAFLIIIMGLGQGVEKMCWVGTAVMIGTAAYDSYADSHNLGAAIYLGLMCIWCLWKALSVGCVQPLQEAHQQEQNTSLAIDQGLKTIIFQQGSRQKENMLGEDGVGEGEEGGFISRTTNSLRRQYSRMSSLVLQAGTNTHDNGQAEDDQEEECPICLEVFENGEELAASGCGHYFHTACVKEWVQVDSREHNCQIRCPVCRFDVLDGVGAPTPSQIKHMRPDAPEFHEHVIVVGHNTSSSSSDSSDDDVGDDGDLVEVDLDVLEAGQQQYRHGPDMSTSSDVGRPRQSMWSRARSIFPSFHSGRPQHAALDHPTVSASGGISVSGGVSDGGGGSASSVVHVDALQVL